MTQAVGYVDVVVRDYDEALAYFINVVGISKSGLLSGGGPDFQVLGRMRFGMQRHRDVTRKCAS